MRSRLPLLLAVIFAACHFVIIGEAILQSPAGGEGFAYAVFIYDLPLFAVCAFPVGEYLCYGMARGHYSILLMSGTVMYGIAGFVIGIVIRSLVSSRDAPPD